MIYLDWNATAPLREEAFAAMEPYLRESYGNPSSIHAAGRKARVALDEARDQVADLIGASEREVVFTSGATEANNLALLGVASRMPGAVFCSSPVEHPSVLEPLKALAARKAIEWRTLPMDETGTIGALDAVRESALTTVMMANNETGILYPVADIAAAAHEAGGLFHSDVTQAVGRVPVDVTGMAFDMASLSAHKIGGPKGVGAFFIRKGVILDKVLHGGRQERSRRPGTENVAAIVGFGAAAQAALRDVEANARRMATLRERLWHGLQQMPMDVECNTPWGASVPNTLHVSFAQVDGNFLLQRLDMMGLCVSSGSACASGSPEPSPVLTAMGLTGDRVRGAMRFSLGYASTEADVDETLRILHRCLDGMKSRAS